MPSLEELPEPAASEGVEVVEVVGVVEGGAVAGMVAIAGAWVFGEPVAGVEGVQSPPALTTDTEGLGDPEVDPA